jgi:hypothetical protein
MRSTGWPDSDQRRAHVSGLQKAVMKAISVALLYALASPILLFKAVRSIRKQLAAIDRIRDGFLDCPWCGETIALNRVARCSVCSATTPGSLLRCSHCKTTFSTVTCDMCSSTVRVL